MQSVLQYQRLAPKPPFTNETSVGRNARSSDCSSKEAEQNLVNWEGPFDPSRPRNWSLTYKIWISALVSMNVFALDWCSAADSQALSRIASEYGVSHRVESIGSALFVFGIATGALFAGPITDTVGRNPIYIGGRIVHFFFILGTALAPNISVQLLCRFFGGFGASIILAIHGASIADIFGQDGRSLAWPFVALWSFLGTVLPPVPGAWIAQNSTMSWRWTDWIAVIMSGTTLVISFIFLPETFAPILLKWKASQLRKATGDKSYTAPIESKSSFSKRLKSNFKRAFIMTTHEYIVIFLGLWLIVVYVVVFGFLSGMEFLFTKTYAFSLGFVGTSFSAIALGVIFNTMLAFVFAYNHRVRSMSWKRKNGEDAQLPPEFRMIPAFPVAICLPVSLFWLGWTNYSSISPWSGLGAVTLFGFSWAGIYVAVYHYIFDTYSIYAGSALATITFFRYSFAGAIQIISRDMWDKLGTQWACTLLGCIATILLPVPIVLWIWGEKIRSVSRYARETPNIDEEDLKTTKQVS